MSEFSFLRHGHKVEAGTARLPLEQSGLTLEQQEKWKEAQAVLGDGVDPEITYENVPLIEKLASEIFEELPEKALLLFTSTNYPRTRMTSALLSVELARLVRIHPEKDIDIATIAEPKAVREQEESLTNLPSEGAGFVDLWRDFKASYRGENDAALSDYFAQSGGGKNHPKAQEMVFELVNKDLASENSIFRKAAQQMKRQIEAFKQVYESQDRPVYFFGIGHNTTLVALDVAINHRDRYDHVDQIPTPLTLWKVDL